VVADPDEIEHADELPGPPTPGLAVVR